MSANEIGRCALGAACALFDADGRVLLVRHSYGLLNWELPGGLAMPREDPATTAQRELGEETGLRLLPDQMIGIYFEPAHDFGPMLHVVFRFAWEVDAGPVGCLDCAPIE